MSSTLNGNCALQHFKRGNVLIKIQYAVKFSPTIQVLMVLQHAIMKGEAGQGDFITRIMSMFI